MFTSCLSARRVGSTLPAQATGKMVESGVLSGQFYFLTRAACLVNGSSLAWSFMVTPIMIKSVCLPGPSCVCLTETNGPNVST